MLAAAAVTAVALAFSQQNLLEASLSWHGHYKMNCEWITEWSFCPPEIFREGRVGPDFSKGFVKKKPLKLEKHKAYSFKLSNTVTIKLYREFPALPVLWSFHFHTWRWNSVPGSLSIFSNNMTSLTKVSTLYYCKQSQIGNY